MAQAQVHKQPAQQEHGDSEEVPEVQPKDERDQQLSDDVDDLLDEIDAVLEENAEAFVQNYVQRGGE